MALRVGIISANWGAMAHLPAWRAVPGVEVTSICTSRQETAEAAAKNFKIPRAFWNAEQMAADPEIDIVDCGTSPTVRHSMVLAALRNGKHVYNGIPCAAGIDRARELHDAWKASGKVAIVDAFSQWIPAHRMAKEIIESDAFGRPLAGACAFQMALFNQPHPAFPYNWFWKGGLGVSALRNLGSHALHMLVYLFGEVEELAALDTQLLSEWRFPDGSVTAPETNDCAFLILRFKNGVTMQLNPSWSATLGQGWSLDAFGTKGRITLKAPSFPTSKDTQLSFGQISERTGPFTPATQLDPVTLPERLAQTPEVNISADTMVQASHPMALSMLNMVKAIRGEAKAAPDFEQAWQVERILEAARRASTERRWVRLEEIG